MQPHMTTLAKIESKLRLDPTAMMDVTLTPEEARATIRALQAMSAIRTLMT